MSFYVFTTNDGVHYRHCDAPLSVAIVDNAMKPVSATFHPLGDDFDCAESAEDGLFALAYWQTADLQIFNLRSGASRHSFAFRKVEALRFDETGRKLLLKSGSQVVLLDLATGARLQIKGLLALNRAVAIKGTNDVISPSQKKGELLRVSQDTGSGTAISLPIDATFFDLKQNPASGELVLIDRKKGIHCVDPSTWRVIWSASLKKELGKDHTGVGQFSGNGDLFGAAVAADGHNYTLVLDTKTGQIVRRIDGVCCGLPWRGTMVRESSTHQDSYLAAGLDLASGAAVEVDVAATGF